MISNNLRGLNPFVKNLDLCKEVSRCQLDITCSSPLVLAVPKGDWAVTAAYKLLEQSPTLLLRQLPQIYEYTHFSRLLYAYCTPVTATVSRGSCIKSNRKENLDVAHKLRFRGRLKEGLELLKE